MLWVGAFFWEEMDVNCGRGFFLFGVPAPITRRELRILKCPKRRSRTREYMRLKIVGCKKMHRFFWSCYKPASISSED